MGETRSSPTVSTKLQRIAEAARQHPTRAFTTLAHHIDIDWLREAYRRTRKDGATGIDGQTAAEYAANLEPNLQSLLDRIKSGAYRAPPVRRVHIPKGDGRQNQTRPIGIPTFEDKVLQRAVTMLLEAIYEQDFLNCSYGFRPNRSAHQALEAVRDATMPVGGGWVLEVDIRKMFDRIDRKHLRQIVRRRVRDGVLLRILGKWLNAGVMEEGNLSYPEAGTPQGGVASPLLANIYLHEVIDEWFIASCCPG
jgi:group II intron reverse transcriptase/maturase